MKGESYSEFVEKFKPKLTTDECYTPPVVYDAIRDYVNEHIFSLEGHRIVRPFFPGGDFEHFDYQPNDIVLDNPPFSILARIVKFYLSKKIKFWLFAPREALFNYLRFSGVVCYVSCTQIVYHNGVNVNTSFITNLIDPNIAFIVDGNLRDKIIRIQKEGKQSKTEKRVSYLWDKHIISSSLCGQICKSRITWTVRRQDCVPIDGIGSTKIFGRGALLSDKATLQRIKKEKEAREEEAREKGSYYNPIRIELTDKEKEIIKNLQ